jgi:glucose/arabinose dehydrogenase
MVIHFLALLGCLIFQAPEKITIPVESDFYEIVTLTDPEGSPLEVSGMMLLEDGRPMVATRRGEVWIIDNAYGEKEGGAKYTLFTDGLQEPLGLLGHEGWIYCAQRGELSRMRDTDGDDRVDEIETVCDTWRISGNYHEYNFGPRLGPDGNFWITTNKPFGEQAFGKVNWRGFALRITPEGRMLPTSSGLRSPAGLQNSPWGDMFYTDNQGEWCGASKLSHLEPGDFHGHPWGIKSCDLPAWEFDIPASPPDGLPMPEVAETHPSFKLPAVWFPYDKMGQSPAGMAWDTTAGKFGPFAGQLFVTDQHHSSLMRVSLEKIEGHWQGACYPFREGFQCGALRVAWGSDGSLFVGETNRGWGSRGTKTEGLERLVWKGRVPFEVRSMLSTPTGFRLEFTEPVEPTSAAQTSSYVMSSYTYLLHSPYGSPEVLMEELEITKAVPSTDRLSVELTVTGLREGFVHELHSEGVRSAAGDPLLHAEAFYTLIHIAK